MNLRFQLPPKRFESAEDSKYDSLRFYPWFHKLLKRKLQIPALEQAYKMVQHGEPQWKAAAEFKVDERELRDYGKLVSNMALEREPVHQRVIDSAYTLYVDSHLKLSFSFCMERAAEHYGLDPRACRELWEIDPTFYPTGYDKETK